MLKYAKALVAVAIPLVSAVIAAAADKSISFDEASGIWAIIVAAITGVAVAATPNKPA